ncbi:unnamed protein product, partial [Mesorhabditis belari]|uniref:Protein kinase domain-containing protein n=1 Tax=Mesorhabditis belari TaxID=2138241 RepID=A0AAF3F5J9_9BILA
MSSCVIVHSLAETTRGSVQPGVHLIAYDFDTNPRTLQDSIQATTSRSSVRNCGLNIQCADGRLALTNDPNTVVDTKGVLRRGSPSRRFFAWLIGERLADGSFLDFFLIKPIENCAQLGVILQTLTGKKVSVRFIPRFTATDLQPHNRRIVAVYFKLTSSSSSLREGGGGRSGVEAELSRVPSAIANYERIRVVGKGAFGAAVLYRRREDESLVIIKEISMHQLAATERQLAKNEVDVLARLEHPHIVSYFDSFEEDGLLLIEMEYADGGTLAQFLSACTDFVGEDTVTALFEQIFSAVAYLHENKVLHRDLKTANIFLTQDGDVKIGDFGISKLMGAETLSKGATTLVGTPHYLSPEMVIF